MDLEELKQVVAVIRALIAALFRALILVPALLVAVDHEEIKKYHNTTIHSRYVNSASS